MVDKAGQTPIDPFVVGFEIEYTSEGDSDTWHVRDQRIEPKGYSTIAICYDEDHAKTVAAALNLMNAMEEAQKRISALTDPVDITR